MANDILFKNEDFVFSYRVGGILIHDGKILLQKPKNDDYSIIGGARPRCPASAGRSDKEPSAGEISARKCPRCNNSWSSGALTV